MSETVLEQAREVVATAGAETRYDQALALEQWFRNTGGFEYSLDAPDVTDRDAVEAFLEDRQGYCVQFASTMALMARALDIPARVAVGFLAGEEVATDRWSIRADDAHAWPELYFDGGGLGAVRADPGQPDRPAAVLGDPRLRRPRRHPGPRGPPTRRPCRRRIRDPGRKGRGPAAEDTLWDQVLGRSPAGPARARRAGPGGGRACRCRGRGAGGAADDGWRGRAGTTWPPPSRSGPSCSSGWPTVRRCPTVAPCGSRWRTSCAREDLDEAAREALGRLAEGCERALYAVEPVSAPRGEADVRTVVASVSARRSRGPTSRGDVVPGALAGHRRAAAGAGCRSAWAEGAGPGGPPVCIPLDPGSPGVPAPPRRERVTAWPSPPGHECLLGDDCASPTHGFLRCLGRPLTASSGGLR